MLCENYISEDGAAYVKTNRRNGKSTKPSSGAVLLCLKEAGCMTGDDIDLILDTLEHSSGGLVDE